MIEYFEQQLNSFSNKLVKPTITSLGGIIAPGEVELIAFTRSESGTENNLEINNKLTRLSIDELKYYYSEHYSYVSSLQGSFCHIPIITKK